MKWVGGKFIGGKFAIGRFNRLLTPPVPANPVKNYWSLLCTETQNAGWYGIRNLEFRATLGGADLTNDGAGGTAIAGADRGPPREAAQAFDNNSTDTYWGCDKDTIPSTDCYVGMNLTTASAVLQISMQARDDASFYDQMPRAFILRYSDDGVTWVDHFTITGEPNWSRNEIRTYDVV